MKPQDLILKCYAREEEGSWVALCIDFNLAAQAESCDAAKAKLESMIAAYVREALTTDAAYSAQLLARRAPWTEWAKYYFYRATAVLHPRDRSAFHEVMPMRPA